MPHVEQAPTPTGRRWPLLVAVLAALAGPWGCAEPLRVPRLTVVLVVDQMRPDSLSRFEALYEGGLARLLARGAVFTEAHHDHAITATAPGHATLATGQPPSVHGIVANSWWDRERSRLVYAVDDDSVPVVGGRLLEPRRGVSPANLRAATAGDRLKARDPASRVYAVAIKDRAAVSLAGRRADAAFWLEVGSGRFVTSRHYRHKLPRWAEQFNEAGHARRWEGQSWTRLLPPERYATSREDDFAFEADGIRTTFPHELDGALTASPFGDQLTFEFARRLIESERLGADEVPDLLWVGASAADAIGHAYGPFSQEAQDYYLRLDRMLGEWMDYLDEAVGAEHWAMVLTSDHGVLPLPEMLSREGLDAGRIPGRELEALLQELLREAAQRVGLDRPPRPVLANGLAFDYGDAVPPLETQQELRRVVAQELALLPWVEDVFTFDELLSTETPDRAYLAQFRNSFFAPRAPDLMVRVRRNYLAPANPTGTNHGSPYEYDTHVPLLLFGPGIRPGRHARPVRTLDLVPTLLEGLQLEPAPELSGRPLVEALGASPRKPL